MSRTNRGVSLAEVLTAAALAGLLAMPAITCILSALRGVGQERTCELALAIAGDLLEAHGDDGAGQTRTLTVEEAVDSLGFPSGDAADVQAALARSGVKGFDLEWHRDAGGEGDRLDVLWCRPRPAQAGVGQTGVFRVYRREP